MKTFGVDVSHWEGLIDWTVAARWVPFVYYKCTDGIKFIDSTFELNKAGCMAAGIPHAPYHYYQPAHDPIAQADHFIRTAGKGYGRYIVDLEAPERVEGITSKLQAFLERVEQLTAIKPAIYTSAGYWNDFIHPKPAWAKNFDLIVAHYTRDHQPLLPIGWSTWRIWQFSDYWFFPGCTATADANWFNGDLAAARVWFGNYRVVDPPIYNKTQARSLFPDLHIRHLPSALARQIGHLSKGETVQINELGGKEVWIKHTRGWTCVEKDGYRYMEVVK